MGIRIGSRLVLGGYRNDWLEHLLYPAEPCIDEAPQTGLKAEEIARIKLQQGRLRVIVLYTALLILLDPHIVFATA